MLRPTLNRIATVTLLSTALVQGQAAFAKDEPPTPLTVDASFNPVAAASKGFTIADTKALKGIKRVAVPVFAVEFITADNVSAQTSSFGASGRSSLTSYYKLSGVGEADFQVITDALYSNFLSQLKASGVEVLEARQVIAAPTYRKLVAGGSPAPIKNDSSMMMSPPGLGIYGFAKTGGGNSSKSNSVFGSLADVGAGFAAVGAISDTIQLATELDASLIEVRLRVNFAQLTNETKGFFGSMASAPVTSAKVFPSVDNVMMGVQSGSWRSTVTMKHTLSLDGAAFSDIREKAPSTGEKVGAVAVELLKLAIGSRDSNDSREREVIADPVKYKEVVGGGLNSAASMLVAVMQTER